MKAKILDNTGKESGNIELPAQFNEQVRSDLIQRAVLVIQNNKRQPYGNKKDAGGLHSAKLSRRRRDYKGSYGHGISRVPRKILSRNGTRFNWQGAVAPGTVGGRRAHPPKAEKEWSLKINKKERRKAIRCAIAATIDKELVIERGHKIPKLYPFIISKDLEALDKTKSVKDTLDKLGFREELQRSSVKKVRAGKGKARGRKYKTKKGILLVVSNKCSLLKSGINIPGIDVVQVKDLNAEQLAPGGIPGRITLFTEGAIERMSKEKLFM